MTTFFIKTLLTSAMMYLFVSGAWAGSNPSLKSSENILDPNQKSIGLPSLLEEEKTLAEPFKKDERLSEEENGFLAMKMGDLKAAKQAFTQSLQENPQNVRVLIALARIAIHHREPAQIEKYLKQAMAVEPSNGDILQTYGHFLTSQSRFGEAEKIFTKATRQNPSDPTNPFHLGRLYVKTKQYTKAQHAFEAALQLDKTLILGHLGLGDSFAFQGKHEEALAAYTTILDLNANFVAAHIKIAQIHDHQSNMDEAEDAYRTALEIDPIQGIALNNLAWLLADKKEDLDDALILAKKAVSLSPKNPSVYDTLGWVYRARGELEKANAAFMQGTALPPLDPSLLYHLGIVLSEQGKPSQAAVAFQNALELAPKFANAKDAKSRLEQLGKTKN